MEPGARRRVPPRLAPTARLMAGSATAQDRLDQIVRIVAAEMVAEVCSCYIMRAGEVLELFADERLRAGRCNRTRFRAGEGLVGVVGATARPLPLADAQPHPDFAYRPEDGDGDLPRCWACRSCARPRGAVLVVQNRTRAQLPPT